MATLFLIIALIIVVSLLSIGILRKKTKYTAETKETQLTSPHKGGESIQYANSTVMQFGKGNPREELHYEPSNSHIGIIPIDYHPGLPLDTRDGADIVDDVITGAVILENLLETPVDEVEVLHPEPDDCIEPPNDSSYDSSSNDSYSSNDSSDSSSSSSGD